MSTQTEQQYIVHLDIRATALDPADAVQEALEQVLLGGLGNVACSVEAVGSGGGRFPVPTRHAEARATRTEAWGVRDHSQDHSYRGEFLG